MSSQMIMIKKACNSVIRFMDEEIQYPALMNDDGEIIFYDNDDEPQSITPVHPLYNDIHITKEIKE